MRGFPQKAYISASAYFSNGACKQVRGQKQILMFLVKHGKVCEFDAPKQPHTG